MADFTVRVELYDADSDDYDKLHESMKNFGYSRIITDIEGVRYYLPTAEYTATKEKTSAGIREQVAGIASAVKMNPRILVTEVASRSWQLVKV